MWFAPSFFFDAFSSRAESFHHYRHHRSRQQQQTASSINKLSIEAGGRCHLQTITNNKVALRILVVSNKGEHFAGYFLRELEVQGPRGKWGVRYSHFIE